MTEYDICAKWRKRRVKTLTRANPSSEKQCRELVAVQKRLPPDRHYISVSRKQLLQIKLSSNLSQDELRFFC